MLWVRWDSSETGIFLGLCSVIKLKNTGNTGSKREKRAFTYDNSDLRGISMEIVQGYKEVQIQEATGVGLGNFDGLHIGHMALMNTLIYESRLMGIAPTVFTFTKHPDHILRKGLYQPLITSLQHKTEMLSRLDLDWLLLQDFDETFSQMTAEDFIEKILFKALKAKLVVIGFNYCFGFMGRGDGALLKKMGERYGYKVIVVPPVSVDQEVVSSTLIRSYILHGDMERAFHLLGRHFSIPGKVADGRRIGREIGFPTANLYPDPEMAIPDFGVYLTRTKIEKKWYDSITNIGNAPTIRKDGMFSIETHLFNFSENLYGENIEVIFLKKMRGEALFPSKEALIVQITKDVAEAKATFAAP